RFFFARVEGPFLAWSSVKSLGTPWLLMMIGMGVHRGRRTGRILPTPLQGHGQRFPLLLRFVLGGGGRPCLPLPRPVGPNRRPPGLPLSVASRLMRHYQRRAAARRVVGRRHLARVEEDLADEGERRRPLHLVRVTNSSAAWALSTRTRRRCGL